MIDFMMIPANKDQKFSTDKLKMKLTGFHR